jgi:VWFA-related protein
MSNRMRMLVSTLACSLVWMSAASGAPASGQEPTAPGASAETSQVQAPDAPDTPESPEARDGDQPTPVFRTGIDFVRVDAIVTSRDGQPVTDLSADDFEVFEDGVRQQVETFRLVQVQTTRGPGDPEPRQIRTASDEEIEAARDDSRIVAIFLDDYHVREVNSIKAREALIDFVTNDLAPSDLVMLMYPLTPLSDLRLTRDHESVARALRSFSGVKYDYRPRNNAEAAYMRYPPATIERVRLQVTMSAIKGLAVRLGSLREGRKAMLLVSEGFSAILPPGMTATGASGLVGAPSRFTAGADVTSAHMLAETEVYQDLREVYDAANRNNTAIYALDPRGLAVNEFDISESVNTNFDRTILRQTTDSLRTLAENTDGRAMVGSNNLRRGLGQMLEDSSTYYLLGYTSSQGPQDGKFHEIDVRVNRRDVQIRSRQGYWALTESEVARASAPAKPGPPPDVNAALGSLAMSSRGRVIQTWIGMAPAGDGRTRVTFVWESAGDSGGRLGAPARVRLMAVDAAGDPFFRGVTPGEAATAGTAGPRSVTFDADPGTLELLLTVEGAEAEVLDKDVREIAVPDLTGPDVRVTTPQIFRARTAREWQALAADAAATPVVGREFSRTERLLIRFDVLGAGGPMPAVRLLNRAGDFMVDLPLVASVAGAEGYQADVPLSALAAGEYLIELAAGDVRELVAIRVTG